MTRRAMYRLLPEIYLTVVAFACGGPAAAQQWPAKPVRLIAPFAAGGATDTVTRTYAERLSAAFGQTFIVDNRPGASGTIGLDLAAKAVPDGYTLLIANVGMLSVAQFVQKLPYDPQRDFAPITNLIGGPSWLLVHPSVPARSVKELIALAKARPGQLTYGSAGTAQVSHLNGELFKVLAGVDLLHVPYKGTGPIIPELLGGQISMSFSTAIENLQFVRAGRVRALAITSLKRSPVVPEVPTVDESGLKGFEVLNWNGIVAPAGTPREIVARLNRDIVRATQQPDVRERVGAQGNLVIGDSPEEFAAYIRLEADKWSAVVKKAGIRID